MKCLMNENDLNAFEHDDVFAESVKYFGGDELAANTWINKYALQDNDGKYLESSPDDMHHRLAHMFYEIEKRYENKAKPSYKLKLSKYGYERSPLDENEIYELFKNFKYVIPAGSVMAGLGSKMPVSLSNCWVIDGPNDTIDDIFRVCNEQSQLMKRRGGVGFDISGLRPNGAKVSNSAKTSTGASSFMELFSNVTNTIAQNGRRGALMLSISIKHPDAEEFSEKKQDLTKVTGANVSVQVSDEFMKAVENDDFYFQAFPTTLDTSIYKFDDFELNVLTEVAKNTYVKKIKAKTLWNKIIHFAWNTAEPGILFIDRHHNYSPDGVYPDFAMTSTNPCGEIGMNEDSCRLININLSSFVENQFTEDAYVDFDKLYTVAYETTHLADDLVDLEFEAIERILDKINSDNEANKSHEYAMYERLLAHSKKSRRCGIGFTALSDMIAKMNLKYDSDESLDLIDKVLRTMFIAETNAQIDLAITRGKFPGYDKSLELKGNEWYDNLKKNHTELYDRMMMYGRRSVSYSTVPPAGTVSLLAKSSSGIEPVFMPYYKRRVKCTKNTMKVDFIDNLGVKFTEYIVVHPLLKDWAIFKYGESANDFTEAEWNEAYKLSPWFNSTANDIDWTKRVEMQSIVQKYITHSISSTINLPNTVTEAEVSNIYVQAWKMKLKGITVYRDGCRAGVLVSTKKNEDSTNKEMNKENNAPKRPKELKCRIFRFKNKGEKWVGVIGILNGRPYEIFSGLNEKLNIPDWVEEGTVVKNYENVIDEFGEEKKKSRYDICYTEKDGNVVCVNGLSRTFNQEFWNYGKLISGLLRHNMPIHYIIKVISSLNLDSSNINTWKNGIIRLLRKFEISEELDERCPECGGRLIRENGCVHCADCEWSRCG